VGAVANRKKPFAAIVGGSEVSIVICVIESLLTKVDRLLLGGMLFAFYKSQHSVGSSLVKEDKLDLVKSLMKKAKAKSFSLMLPVAEPLRGKGGQLTPSFLGKLNVRYSGVNKK